MFKNIAKIMAIFVLLVIILLFLFGYITKQDEEVEIIKKIDLDFIGNDYLLENISQIDENDYLLFVRQRAIDDNGEFAGSLTYNYIIYRYNLDTGLFSNNIKFRAGYEYNGINNRDNCFWITLIDYENYEQNNENTQIWKIDYNTMTVKNKFENIEPIYNLIIANVKDYIAYSKADGMYIANNNFKEPKLIIHNLLNEEDTINLKRFMPVEFFQDKLVYMKLGYEWTEGIGVYDIINNEDYFFSQTDIQYLGYKNEYIYYTQQYVPESIYKININTLKEEKIFDIPINQDYLDKTVYLLNEEKYILIVENKYINEDVEILFSLYDIKDVSLIAKYVLPKERYANIDNVFWGNNKIIFTKSYDMFEWRY